MPLLQNAKWEAFVQAIFQRGLNPAQAYVSAGYSENGAAVSGRRLLQTPPVAARLKELQHEQAEIREGARKEALIDHEKTIVRLEISDRTKRVQALQELVDKFRVIFAERAAAEAMAGVPGGSTGLVVHQVKAAGKFTVDEYVVDTAVTREYRDILRQAAQELGQWTEKSEQTQKWDGSLDSLTPDQLKKIQQQMAEIAFAGNPAALLAAQAEVERESLQ